LDRDVHQCESAYQIITRIAETELGDLALARQLGTLGFSKTVAIKTVRRELLERCYYRDSFIDEVKLVATLIHENIQQVYQLLDLAGSLGLVLEWVHGVDLERINARLDEREGYLQPDLAAFIVSRVARAIAYANERRSADGTPLELVHRAIHPGNILVSWGGVVKLADFGMAKATGRRRPTFVGQSPLRVPYLAPEQVRGDAVDHRSDIFALGLVLFELLTGEQAFPVTSIEALLARHAEPIPSPREWNPAIRPELEAVMRRMLAVEPAARYPRARQIVADLERVLYSSGYGPTNERLREYLDDLFPGIDKHRPLPPDDAAFR